jgi:glycerate 2-kinase
MANIHNQVQSTTAAPEVVLRKMFDAAVASAQPLINIKQHLPSPPKGRTIIIGAGKASAAMAHALEQHWQGPISGVVVTRYGYAVACQHITILEASHPVPDMAGQQAATDILATVSDLTADDLVICLISGGGSSLMSLPAEGISFADKQAVNKTLLSCGATIQEMNCIRKHISLVKGGQLAAQAYPAKILSLMISDVPGDDMSSIASGPTVADNSTFADAINIVCRYDMQLPDSVMAYLQQAQNETPNQDDNRLSTTKNIIIAAPQMSLEAAAEVAIEHGFTPLILGDSIEGESRDVALVHAGIAQQVVRHAQPIKPPCILLSGGETTVTLKGNGRGGRNAEFALSLAVALKSEPNIWGIACDTDGIDGSEDNAGAVITPTTLNRAFAAGCKAIDYLDNNDGYSFFETIGDLVMTGPTMTNVNDFRAILITDQNVK